MILAVSVEVLKDEIFKLSMSEKLRGGLCTVCTISYFLAGEGEKPFNECLSGGRGLGMARGMLEA